MDWSAVFNVTVDAYKWLQNYIDIPYVQWLLWMFYPLILTIIIPILIVLFLYASAIFLHLYGRRHFLREALKEAVDRGDFWNGARQILAVLWDGQGRIWHGYEVIGMDKIPATGPALLIYYHGAIPIDLYYLMAKLHLHQNRQVRAVGDRFLFRIPGFKLMLEVFNVLPGTVSRGVEEMNAGHLLAIAPGGVREALFSDVEYNLMWGSRIGFAKIAVEAKVPVVPIFTQNCREAFRALSLGPRSWLRRVYEKTRLPLVPVYGGFPVKMRTFIGDPIPYDPSLSPQEVADKVKKAIEVLVARHQQRPGNILRALLERFYTPEHCKVI